MKLASDNSLFSQPMEQPVLYQSSYSKPYYALVSIPALALLATNAYYFRRLPVPLAWGFGGILLMFLVISAVALLSRGPVVTVTKEGITYCPRWLPILEWPDIITAQRSPRRVSDGHGQSTFYLLNRWRPVVLEVRGYTKYAGRAPWYVKMELRDPQNPDIMKVEVKFVGMTGDSAEFERVVRRELDSRRHLASP